jgi:hypothetical protein
VSWRPDNSSLRVSEADGSPMGPPGYLLPYFGLTTACGESTGNPVNARHPGRWSPISSDRMSAQAMSGESFAFGAGGGNPVPERQCL